MRYIISVFLLYLSACCGSQITVGELVTLDLEAAIDNRQPFDLREIADNIDLIALDNSPQDALLGDIRKIAESKTGFYITDTKWSAPVKRFDRTGKFIGTRGQIGRGPNELLEITTMAVDYETDDIYLRGYDGGTALVSYDDDGKLTARTPLGLRGGDALTVYEDKVILSFNTVPNNSNSTVNTIIALLDVFSLNLQHERTINVVDKGPGMILVKWKDTSGMLIIDLGGHSRGILSNNGKTLMVKEERNDTVFYYRNGILEPALVLDFGRYAPPAEVFGIKSTAFSGDSHLTQNILESDKYIFVATHEYKDNNDILLILDRDNLYTGFSAMGSNGSPGLFFNGIKITPCYVRDNRLVGYMRALDIVDKAEAITNPDLKALAATLREDSNPVIVVAKLKK